MSTNLIGTRMTIPLVRDEGLIPTIFAFVEEQADAAIRWYWAAKAWPARLSKGLRFVALLLFGVGALPPFLDTIGIVPKDGVNWTSVGYLALALGGSALAFDHFFGLSSSYTRYMTTAMSLERARNEFRMDWLALLGKYAPITSATNVEPFFARASAFLKVELDLVDRETQAWVAEFRTNLAELEKAGRAPQEIQHPGGLEHPQQSGEPLPKPPLSGTLDVTVIGAVQDNDEVDIFVDEIPVTRRKGPGQAHVGHIAPGPHVLIAKNLGTGLQGIVPAVASSASTARVTVAVPSRA